MLDNYKKQMIKCKKIGSGGFGVVYKVSVYGVVKAIKIIKLTDIEQGIPSSALREITILKRLKNHPNIVNLLNVGYSPKELRLGLTFEYCQYDLHSMLYSSEQIEIPNCEIKRIIYQILNGIAYCHNNKIVHRDLKPQNILYSVEGFIKIADFGLARIILEPQMTLTGFAGTRGYIAPQYLLGEVKYPFALDIWAIGCIFAELANKKRIFSDKTQIGQLFKMFQYLGTPDIDDWPSLDKLQHFKGSFPKWSKTDNLRKDFVSKIEQTGVDLLEAMLTYDPVQRITAQDALQHPYFQEVINQTFPYEFEPENYCALSYL